MDLLLIHAVHLGATWAMIGLIWFVQVVHYPLFALVGEPGFIEYEQRHTVQTGWVVGPFMLAEAGSATYLAITSQTLLGWIGIGLVLAIWMTTALVQVPLHGALNRAWDGKSHVRLVRSNWIRTVLWSARGPVAFLMLVSTLGQ